MNSSTEKALKKAGTFLLGVAEFGADSMRSTAKNASKNKKLSEEQREQYAEMADGFGGIRDSIKEYREKIQKSVENCGAQEDSSGQVEDSISTAPRPIDDEKVRLTYAELEKRQESESFSENDYGSKALDEWEKEWSLIGALSETGKKPIPECENKVGLISLSVDGKIVYLVRAVDLKLGGLNRKINHLRDLALQEKKTGLSQKIKNNFEKIVVEALIVGEDMAAINVCRNLEIFFIEKYQPLWM